MAKALLKLSDDSSKATPAPEDIRSVFAFCAFPLYRIPGY